MTVFYIISLLVLAPLIVERPNTIMDWIQYLSTEVLQACALPLLGYTTNKQGNIQSKLLQETHDTIMNEIKIIKKNNHMQRNKELIIVKRWLKLS